MERKENSKLDTEIMNKEYCWDFAALYKTEEDLLKDNKRLYEIGMKIAGYEGKLNTKENILSMLKLSDEADMIEEKVATYLFLKSEENRKNERNLEMMSIYENMNTEVSKKLIFIEEEILQNSEEFLNSLIEDEEFMPYNKFLRKIVKRKGHTLTKEQELVFAHLAPAMSFSTIYDLIENEMEFRDAIDSEGKAHKVTHELYSKLLESEDRMLRKNAFKSIYEQYKKAEQSISEVYMSKLKLVNESVKLEKYASLLEASVQSDESSIKVYDTLVKSVNNNMKIYSKVLLLKKKLSGLSDFTNYDLYRNPYKLNDKKFEYEEAKKIVLDALSILGKEYTDKLKEAFETRWIDVYPKENKGTGAFSTGVYGVHPYVMLNYTDTANDVSTLAHEMGHAMHSYYADSSQSITNAGYTIMTAEVASTVNEIILAEKLLEKEKDITRKKAILLDLINTVTATLVRQTMFAEFERNINEKIYEGIPITYKQITETYKEIVDKYFEAIEVADEIRYEWLRIPHFYNVYYVYKYATGISSAIYIAKNILEGKEGYKDRYIEMLKSGGSKGSLDTLKMAGVDLEDENTYDEAFRYLEQKVEELERLENM